MRVEVTDAVPEADVLAFPVGPKGLPALAGDQDAERVAEEEDVGCGGRADGRALPERERGRPGESCSSASGRRTSWTPTRYRTAAASVAEAAERVGGTLAWVLDDSLPHSEQARAVVDGLLLGSYDPGRWKTGTKSDHPFERLVRRRRRRAQRPRPSVPRRSPTAPIARGTSRTRGRTSSHQSVSPSEPGASEATREPDRRGARPR